MKLPRLYAIADADLLTARSIDLVDFASELLSAGVILLQYRNKTGSARTILQETATLNHLRAEKNLQLLLNDRADLALLAQADGVHLGQDDLPAADTRLILGPEKWIGVSTHHPEQVRAADETPCDYIAYGPIFPTASKQNPDPVVGLDGLAAARRLTRKPIVAIGGITHENCRAVIDAGADSVAIISALVPQDTLATTRQLAESFLVLLQ